MPCSGSGDRAEKGQRGSPHFTTEQLWEDKHGLQGLSPALGRGRRCECGAVPPEGPTGDLPTHRMLKQKPCDVDLLTSWSGRLSKPTWPDRDRFLRSSFCKSQEKSIQQSCSTPGREEVLSEGHRGFWDTRSVSWLSLPNSLSSAFHPSLLWGSGGQTPPAQTPPHWLFVPVTNKP